MNVGAAGKEVMEQFAGCHCPVIIEIHAGNRLEKLVYGFDRYFKICLQQTGEIIFIKSRAQGKLRIVKDNIPQLHDGIHDCLIPVFFTGLDHAVGKSVQGNIENMAPPLEPCGQAAESVMIFQQEDFMSAVGETVGGGKTAETGTYNDNIVVIVKLRK
jgi:hypothetical protein